MFSVYKIKSLNRAIAVFIDNPYTDDKRIYYTLLKFTRLPLTLQKILYRRETSENGTLGDFAVCERRSVHDNTILFDNCNLMIEEYCLMLNAPLNDTEQALYDRFPNLPHIVENIDGKGCVVKCCLGDKKHNISKIDQSVFKMYIAARPPLSNITHDVSASFSKRNADDSECLDIFLQFQKWYNEYKHLPHLEIFDQVIDRRKTYLIAEKPCKSICINKWCKYSVTSMNQLSTLFDRILLNYKLSYHSLLITDIMDRCFNIIKKFAFNHISRCSCGCEKIIAKLCNQLLYDESIPLSTYTNYLPIYKEEDAMGAYIEYIDEWVEINDTDKFRCWCCDNDNISLERIFHESIDHIDEYVDNLYESKHFRKRQAMDKVIMCNKFMKKYPRFKLCEQFNTAY